MKYFVLVSIFVVRMSQAQSLGELAASMKPGSWAELHTNGMVTALARTAGSSGFSTVYADRMVWNPGTEQIFFTGSDESVLQRFNSYDVKTNTWRTLPRPAWMKNAASSGYHHSAIDQTRGLYYYRPAGSNVAYRYHIASQVWSQLPTLPDSSDSCCDALEVFPDYGLVWVLTNGNVFLYRETTNDWTRLATGIANGGTWTFAAYSSVHKVMVFGVAAAGSLHKLDSTGRVSRLRDPFIPIYDGSGINGVFTADPVSGAFLLLTPKSRELYSYDVVSDTWEDVSVASKPNLSGWGIVASPIDNYGVTMFAGCRDPVTCGTYLYKHLNVPRRDVAAPTIRVTGPTSGETISGTVTVTAITTTNSGTVSVRFFVDGIPIGEEIISAPYSVKWNAAWGANGSHVITARARDRAGNQTISVPVRVAVASTTMGPPAPAEYHTRCAASGVIRCYGFDNVADLVGGHPRTRTVPVDSTSSRIYPNPGASKCTGGKCWAHDTNIKASGAGALRFEIPSNIGSDTSGSFRINFQDDFSQQIGSGEEVYVQFRQRFSPELLRRFKTFDGGLVGPKLMILGLGDRPAGTPVPDGRTIAYSCTLEEMVINTDVRFLGPSLYHGCGLFQGLEYAHAGTSDILLQHVGPPYCYYPNDPTHGCFRYVANEWLTFKINVRIAGWGANPRNRVRMWAAREGQRSVLIFDSINSHPNGFTILHTDETAKYGKVWLLPYMTNKDASEVYPTAYTWYDELIISRQDIADPK